MKLDLWNENEFCFCLVRFLFFFCWFPPKGSAFSRFLFWLEFCFLLRFSDAPEDVLPSTPASAANKPPPLKLALEYRGSSTLFSTCFCLIVTFCSWQLSLRMMNKKHDRKFWAKRLVMIFTQKWVFFFFLSLCPICSHFCHVSCFVLCLVFVGTRPRWKSSKESDWDECCLERLAYVYWTIESCPEGWQGLFEGRAWSWCTCSSWFSLWSSISKSLRLFSSLFRVSTVFLLWLLLFVIALALFIVLSVSCLFSRIIITVHFKTSLPFTLLRSFLGLSSASHCRTEDKNTEKDEMLHRLGQWVRNKNQWKQSEMLL